MPTLSLRWFLALLTVFAIAAGVDIYLSRTAVPIVDSSTQRMEVADFMSAARSGQLTAGQIVFRPNATGLADLAGTRSDGSPVRTTARLTDADLAVLREHRFVENDAAALELLRKSTPREQVATVAHAATQILGLLVIITGMIIAVQRYAGRFTMFSAK